MDLRCASNPKDVKHYTTERLREEFHISGLFTPDNSKMVYSHIDQYYHSRIYACKARACIGGR